MALRISFCLAFFLLAALVFADEMLDKTKEAYDFDNWPGRDGALKQGLCPEEVDLSPYEIHSRRNWLFASGEIIYRYKAKGADKPAFEVRIRVLEGVPEAQEHLIKFLSVCTVKVPRGNTLGFSVGDICFAGKDGEQFKLIVFVRNNIFVRIAMLPGAGVSEVEVPPDISEIAGKIDNYIKQAQEAQKPEDLNKPVISELSAAENTTKPDAPVELTLEVSDPKGDKLRIHFDQGGGMVYEHEGKRYFKAEKPGKYTITVCVTNSHLLVTKKSITIEVKE